MSSMKIVAASGKDKIDAALRIVKGYEVVATVSKRSELENICMEYKPDILFVTEALIGGQQLTEILFNIARNNQNIRIIYITGSLDMRQEHRINSLGYLVMTGIYDIITDKKLNMEIMINILNNPKTYDDVAFLTKGIKKDHIVEEDIEFDIPDDDDDEDIYKKVFTFSSIKPRHR